MIHAIAVSRAHLGISSLRYLHMQINPITRLALYTVETTQCNPTVNFTKNIVDQIEDELFHDLFCIMG